MQGWLTTANIWLAIGFAGQALFASRFIIQWFKSEMEGRSVIPLTFWYFSLGGGIILVAYAIYKKDPVFIIGQASRARRIQPQSLPDISRTQPITQRRDRSRLACLDQPSRLGRPGNSRIGCHSGPSRGKGPCSASFLCCSSS